MANPWLDVPLSDYEGHMSAPAVGQLDALADLFAQALAYCRPRSLAILGIAGGNGLDRIDPAVTARILGIDIHPHYLDAVRARYPALPLTLLCADLQAESLDIAPVGMVHAALIFEHAGAGRCLTNALSLVAPAGSLSVVLQLPSTTEPGVSPTPFASIQTLRQHFSLIDPTEFTHRLLTSGFQLTHHRDHQLPGGKAFWLGIFQRTPSS
ncbi:MAG: class I SAM-dependent methyltransferase [Bryobacterales bacterium]|nr:class I SAM-dependent methyltransferase [Bryobacterales bacterium]